MAINRNDVEIRISAVNESSAPLKQARTDFERLQESVKSAASVLDDNKGHPRQYAEAMKSAFSSLPGMVNETVNKVAKSMDELDRVLTESDVSLGVNQKRLKGHEDAAAAIQTQIKANEALKKSEEDLYKAEKSALDHLKDAEAKAVQQSKAAADQRVESINETVQAQRDLLAELDKQARADARQEAARAKKISDAKTDLDASIAKERELAAVREQAAKVVEPLDAQLATHQRLKDAADAAYEAEKTNLAYLKDAEDARYKSEKSNLDHLKDAEDALYRFEKSNLEHLKDAEAQAIAQSRAAAEARVADINKATTAQREMLAEINKQIAAEIELNAARGNAASDLGDIVARRDALIAQRDAVQAEIRDTKQGKSVQGRRDEVEAITAETDALKAQLKELRDLKKAQFSEDQTAWKRDGVDYSKDPKAAEAAFMAAGRQANANAAEFERKISSTSAKLQEAFERRAQLEKEIATLGYVPGKSDRLKEINAQIEAENRLIYARERSEAEADEQAVKSKSALADLEKQRAQVAPEVDRANAEIEQIRRVTKAEEDASESRIKAQQGLVTQVKADGEARIKAQKELTASAKSDGEARVNAQKELAASAKAAAEAEAKAVQDIQELRKPGADRLAEIDKEIAAEHRLQAAKRKIIDAQVEAQAKAAKAASEAEAKRKPAAEAVAAADSEIRAVREAEAAYKLASDGRIKAQQDLTEATRTESKERLAIINKELTEQRKAYNAEAAGARSVKKTVESQVVARDRAAEERRLLADIHAQAVSMSAGMTDPQAMLRMGRSLNADAQGRGMSSLASATRKAGDAQRYLNGETRSGVPVFASLRSEVAGMIGVYAAYTAAVSQAGKVIDAFNTKEAFTVAISSTSGGKTNEAAAQWDYLIAAAKKYKFEISAVAGEYSKLLINSRGAGLSDEQTRTIYEGILAKARATNLTNEQIQNAFRALNQTVSKNQLYAEELRGQLAEAIPGAVNDMARALGYGADRMAEFNKDMEAGTFKADAVVKYARYLMDQSSGSVEAAGNTFKAAVSDLQNILFETRLRLAEGGFMDGMKETVQDLADFFKSDEGQAYMIRLADAANGVVKALAAVARNLDTILAGLAMIVGGKIASSLGKAFGTVAAVSGAGAAGMTAMAGSAGALATALGVLRMAGVALVRVFGGIPGLVIGAALAISQMSSASNAQATAEINSAMDRTKTVIDEIRNAAREANGDLERFRNLLKDAGVDGSKELAAAMVDANRIMDAQAKNFSQTIGNMVLGSSSEWTVPAEERSAAIRDVLSLNRELKRLPYGELEKRVNGLAKAYGLNASQVKDLLGYAAEYDKQNRNRVTLLGVIQGRLEDVSEAELKGGIAAAKAAGDQKAYNEALEALKKLTGDTDAAADFAKTLADISKHANEAAKAVAGTAGEAKKLADIERAVRNAQLTNASRFLEKRYGDAGLTLRPSAGLIGLIEGLNGTVMAAGANGQVGWVPSSPGGGQSYMANTSGRMENKNGRLVSSDPMLRGLTVSQAALLNAIAAPESGGAYNIRFGGAKGPQTFDLNGVHPNVRERNPANGTYSTAAGRYQFIGSTYRGLMGNAPFTPENQDKAALKNAEQAWARNGVKGVSLWDYLDKNGMDQTVRNALKPQWEGFVGNGGFQKAKSTYDASRSLYMASGVTVGSVGATGVSVAPDGSIVRAPAAGAAPTVAQTPLTREQERALEIIAGAVPALPAKARLAIDEAAARNPAIADDMSFLGDLKSGQLTRIADALERVAGAESANAFRRETDIISQAQQADANADAFAAVRETVEAMKFTKDDLANEEARSAAVIRETQEAIKKLTENGASLAVATGKPDDAQARAFIADQAAQRAQVEYGKELADQARKRIEDQKQLNKSNETAIRDARQQAELAAISNEAERERLRIRQQISNEQEDSGLKYTDAQIAARTAAEMAKFEADQAADKAKTAADQSKDVQQGLQDAKDQIALAGEQNELARERLRIEQEIRRQEQESGVAMSDADRNALIQARMDAYVAQNGQAIAERELNDQLNTLQANYDLLRSQYAQALVDKDFDAQGRLKGEIAGVTTEILKAIDALEAFYKKMDGPEGEQGELRMRALRMEVSQGTAEMRQMTPEVQNIAGVIENNLNAAVSKFSQLVAEGMDPWDALKQTVSQAVGQMLIDIGMMIVKAVIANAIMSALGLGKPGGQAGNGSLANATQYLGNMTTTGGIHHTGGIAGDPKHNIDFLSALMNLKPNETPAILERGEEILTAQDPRHRRNLGSAFGRFDRFHTGGVAALGPDAVSSSLAASGSAGRAMSSSVSKAVADAPAPVVNNNNFFDIEDAMNRYLSSAPGEKNIMNVITKKRTSIAGMMR